MTKQALMDSIRGGLIVSCQALPGEPLYQEAGGIMPLLAKAAMEGGAVGIRTSSVRDVRQIMEAVPLPVIGLIKRTYPGCGAYITPSMTEVDALAQTGCQIIALDCTRLTRPGGLTPRELILQIKQKYPQQLLMADCAELQDAIDAARAGVDFVGTTMNGYLPGDPETDSPNFRLVRDIAREISVPVIAEGRIYFPDDARKMLDLGAHAVVVGGAITRPLEITHRFVKALGGR